MAITILGKRSRASDEDTTIISCRAKRPTIVSIIEDDKENNNHSIDLVSPVKRATLVEDINNENTLPTPNTPRHRDSLSKKCPVTPRHRVLVGGGRSGTPRTPRTPTTPSAFVKSVFNDAKKVFTRGADAGELVGRETEKAELELFINNCVETKTGGCLYVSGPPGTGKSAFVTQICTYLQKDQSTNYAYINCMSVKSATELYDLMAAELAMDAAVCQGFSKDALQTTFTKSSNNDNISLVVLDEIDQLLNLDNSTLCSFFEWSFAPDSKLMLIGIANALDLTDRFLPRLKAKNLKPALLPFLPYTAPQIASVLSSRARSLLPSDTTVATADFTPFLHPTAITLISKKIAAQTGDLRKAFDLAFHAIELVEAETKERYMKEALLLQAQQQDESEPASPTRTPLSEAVINTACTPSSPPASTTSTPRAARTILSTATSLSSLTPTTAPRATLAHIVRVTTSTQSASSATARLKTLNLHQKAILCSLVALEAKLLSSCSSLTSASSSSSTSTIQSRPSTITKQRPSLPSSNTPTQRKLFTPTSSSKPTTSTTLHAPTLRTLYTTYVSLCKRDNAITALSMTEFRDVVANLETMSLVSAADACKTSSGNGSGGLFASLTGTPTRGSKGKNATVVPVDERRVKAMVGLRDMEMAVEGVGGAVLRGMLRGE